MGGQPRLVELYEMAASASGEYPFAFTIPRVACERQAASDGRRHRNDNIMPGFSGPDGDRARTAIHVGPFQSARGFGLDAVS